MLGPHKEDPNYAEQIKKLQQQAKENGGVTDWGIIDEKSNTAQVVKKEEGKK